MIVSNGVSIFGSIYVGQKVTELFGDEWLGVAAGILTFFIIIIGELIPKVIGERYKVPLSLFFAKPVRVLVWCLRPLVELILQIEKPLTKRYHQHILRVTEEEIKMMLMLGRDAGTVEMDEELLCNRVFRLNDLKALQMMKPINQIFALPANQSLSQLKETIANSPYSRIAVYDKDPSDIVGTVQQSVLLREIVKGNEQVMIKDLMKKPIFIPHMTKADALLEKFLAYNQHLFIVQDDTGKDVGIVTMEDVLEELFGEIYDEKDIRLKVPIGISRDLPRKNQNQ